MKRTWFLGILAVALTLCGCETSDGPRFVVDMPVQRLVASTPRSGLDRLQVTHTMAQSVDPAKLRNVSSLRLPGTPTIQRTSRAASEANTAALSTGACREWVSVEDFYDVATGEFRYRSECPEGGAIAAVVTAGKDDGTGRGHYTTTYEMRDGSDEVWESDYRPGEEYGSEYVDSWSTDGQNFAGYYIYEADGAVNARETWTGKEGTSVSDYRIEADWTKVGISVFDDPATSVAPDWTTPFLIMPDGSYLESGRGIYEQWTVSFVTAVAVDGRSISDYTYDDPATVVWPDFVGAVAYEADGSGHGAWYGAYDDGSKSHGEDEYLADGSVIEVWTWDDPATAVKPDQDGSNTYLLDGSGTGEVTEYQADGTSVTCDVTLAPDGTVTYDACR